MVKIEILPKVFRKVSLWKVLLKDTKHQSVALFLDERTPFTIPGTKRCNIIVK